MAIDPILYPETESLAFPNKSFYSLRIPVSHWQLRHYISHPEPDTIYYASGRDVYYLNTGSRKRKHVATLPFEARCTASGHGYVCVGGEDDGHFAIIKMEEGRQAEVDAPFRGEDWQASIRAPRATSIRIERIGEHIVNSISIHRIHDEESHLYDIAAVLTNNDKTVRVYSLSSGLEATVIDLPDPMNHATISPDGRMMAAVGDVNTIFFFKRILRKQVPQIPKPHNRLNMMNTDWLRTSSHRLYVPSPSSSRGYFTTAWSPRGHLLAVGSEAGYISLFDTSSMESIETTDTEVIHLVTVASSRPDLPAHTHPGAVRSMLFSPDPWDLLVWAEDQGRICVGDLRTLLREKQIIELDPADKSIRCLNLEDIEADDPPPSIGDDFAWQGSRDPRRGGAIHRSPDGLTQREQLILESLRTARQREETNAARGGTPRTINYTSASLFDQPSSHNTFNARSNSAATQAAFPELSRSATRRVTHNANDGYVLPPLRGFGESSPANSTRADNRRSTDLTSREGGLGNSQRQVPAWAQRASDTSSDSARGIDDSHWRVISDAMDLNLARGPLFDHGVNRDEVQIQERRAQDARERNDQLRSMALQADRLRTLQRNLDQDRAAAQESASVWSRYERFRDVNRPALDIDSGWDLLNRRSMLRNATIGGLGPEIGIRTAGLAISRDGRTVWVASEEGIFEIDLAVKNRLRWPAVDFK